MASPDRSDRHFPNGTRVKFVPDPRRDGGLDYAGHTGSVIYLTTDGFHRVNWDSPTPDDDFFNLGSIFRLDQLEAISSEQPEAKFIINFKNLTPEQVEKFLVALTDEFGNEDVKIELVK